jgi:hypothetical protein
MTILDRLLTFAPDFAGGQPVDMSGDSYRCTNLADRVKTRLQAIHANRTFATDAHDARLTQRATLLGNEIARRRCGTSFSHGLLDFCNSHYLTDRRLISDWASSR